MPIRSLVWACAFWLLTATAATAETIVLVQGYLATAGNWRQTGVTTALHLSGWRDAGHLGMTQGVVDARMTQPATGDRLFTIDLPTEAPVAIQSGLLARYVDHLRSDRPGERIVIVGHSAGGVVARHMMVTRPHLAIAALVTIASPHMGTPAAELGSFFGHTPMAWFAPMMGLSTLNRSQVLYADLWRDSPGTHLGWLNRQRHPAAQYVAVVRIGGSADVRGGDSIVDGWSQDLNAVPALHGTALRVTAVGEHGLNHGDGPLLAQILWGLRGPAL
ncbi:MAG: hypothetical protein NW217_11175 [Hyphomicrobiaceae bacterium]|nr:hypothetical protein [Hyphomicrobiaceae bacterium]